MSLTKVSLLLEVDKGFGGGLSLDDDDKGGEMDEMRFFWDEICWSFFWEEVEGFLFIVGLERI
jgi:hypothetical protein